MVWKTCAKTFLSEQYVDTCKNVTNPFLVLCTRKSICLIFLNFTDFSSSSKLFHNSDYLISSSKLAEWLFALNSSNSASLLMEKLSFSILKRRSKQKNSNYLKSTFLVSFFFCAESTSSSFYVNFVYLEKRIKQNITRRRW